MALFDTIRAGASGAVSFEIERSLRFDNVSESYLTRTPSSSGNRRTWTLSLWIKRSSIEIHNSANAHVLMDARGSVETTFGFDSEDRFYMDIPNRISTTAKFRDVTAWQHWVIAVDTTQSSESNRIKLYVNGDQLTDFDNNSRPSQNYETGINLTQAHQVGRYDNGGHFDGYMADVNLIDGQQLTPSSFAETDSVTGEWIPIDTGSLSFGTNGFRLQFSDNSGTSATTLGKDTSGNSNNYTPNNLSVSAGKGNDSLEDTPTNNYPTLSFINSRTPSRIRNGALDINFTDGDDNDAALATFGMESGKWYFEVQINAGSSSALSSLLGVAPDSYQKLKQNTGINAWPGKDTDSGVGIDGSGAKYVDGNGSTYASSFTTNDIIGVAVDADAAKVAFSKNGQFSDGNGNYNQGANVASGGQVPIDGQSPYFFAVADTSSSRDPQFSLNFGQRAFSYSIPSGYQKLNSQNLPEPVAPRGDKYFDAITYSGTGSQRAVTGYNFAPDWVWVKRRNANNFHILANTILGAGNYMVSNNTDAESSGGSQLINGFNSDGFDVGTEAAVNNSSGTYVGWCWFAGGSTVTNSTGTISAQVRASATSGFSIVSYTGNSTSGATVGHGLGVVPKMVVVKSRSQARGWNVYHVGMGNTKYMQWQQSASQITNSAWWNNTTPSSTTFTVGNDNDVNDSSQNYIAYVFADISGFSKFGIFSGNGSSNGSYVFCGFRPRYLMIKRSDSGNHWVTYDAARSTVNVVDDYLKFDESGSEQTTSQVNVDFCAAGFKMRTGFDIVNAGSGSYIYMAFAENAFKYARAR
tara:strand:- start:54 stop:2471 length:2418 start_codon:yes stop_codon:yes gene_type:complete